MTTRWFQLDEYYEYDGEKCVFFPSLFARGYRFSAEDRATMNSVLEPLLKRRLKFEFIGLFCLVTFALIFAAGAFMVTASNEELDMVLAIPPLVWLAGAVALAGAIVVPILIRLRSKIMRQLAAMGLESNEPPRPDFFIVDGALSLGRLSFAFVALGGILVLVGNFA